MIETHKSLKALNSFAVDVYARYFATVRNAESLQKLLSAHPSAFILGGGSNILLTRDLDDWVIQIAIMGIEKIQETDDHVFLKVGAGENWHQLVMYCVERGYAGIENLSLIPGTVGAAPIQNIGAYGVELQDVLINVDTLILTQKGVQQRQLSKANCGFAYRDSIFKHALKGKAVITQVTLKLNKRAVFHTEYGSIQEKLADKVPTIKNISDVIIQIRQEKLPDPTHLPNAGSFFKNPIIPKKKFLALQKNHPSLAHYPAENDYVKLPAAWLIEHCGFKGKRESDVGVYQQQALVLVNYGHASGMDILNFSRKIQAQVQKAFGVTLMREVNVFPDDR